MRAGSRRGLVALFCADVISVLGDRVSIVAIPWLVLETTGSAAKMGLIVVAEMVPYVVSGVLSAPVADRFGLWRTSIVVDLGSAVAMAAIAFSPGLSFTHLAVLVAVAGALRGLGDRVKNVMFKPLADTAGVRMIRITSSYEGFTKVATLIGAPLGGLMILWFGANGAIWIDAASFAVCGVLVWSMVRLPAAAETAEPVVREPYLTALRGGFAFLRRDRLLLGMMLMIFAINVFSQASTAVFAPLWVDEVFGSPAGLGVLFGGFAAGALLGNVIFTIIAPKLPLLPAFMIGAAVSSAPRLLTLGLSHQLWLVVTVSFLSGAAMASVNPVMAVMLYERIPAELQTRVFGVTGAIGFVGLPIGGVLAGWAVSLFGLRPAIVGAGLLFGLVTVIPMLRVLSRPAPAPEPDEVAT